METQGDELAKRETAGLADYLRIFRQRWWVILAAIVVLVGTSLAISLLPTPQYRSETRLLYSKNNLDQVVLGAQASTGSAALQLQSGVMFIKLGPTAEVVKAQVGSARSASELVQMVTPTSSTATNTINIMVQSADPQEAADLANAYANQFVEFRKQTDRANVAAARSLVEASLEQLGPEEALSEYGNMLRTKYEDLRILESMQDGGFTVIQQAVPAASPFLPRTVRDAGLALVIGLLLGIAIVFVMALLDKRIRDGKTLESEAGVPLLAVVPAIGGRWGTRKDRDPSATIGFRSNPLLLEAFRTLRSNLQYFHLDKKNPTWLVTSGLPRQGKTTTTVNLGLSLALSGKRVILLEADLRRPKLHEYLGIEQSPGLSNVLAGSKRLDEALTLVKADAFLPSDSRRGEEEERRGMLQRNFYVLTSGPLPPNPAELLASDRMSKVIEELSSMTDYLIIDTPPVLPVSDALALAPSADGLILVAPLGLSTRDEVRQVRSIFTRAGIMVIGVVAGGLKAHFSRGRRGGYGYGYGGYGYGYDYGYGSYEDHPSD